MAWSGSGWPTVVRGSGSEWRASGQASGTSGRQVAEGSEGRWQRVASGTRACGRSLMGKKFQSSCLSWSNLARFGYFLMPPAANTGNGRLEENRASTLHRDPTSGRLAQLSNTSLTPNKLTRSVRQVSAASQTDGAGGSGGLLSQRCDTGNYRVGWLRGLHS